MKKLIVILFVIVLSIKSYGQYCSPNFNSNSTYIDFFQFNSLLNWNSGVILNVDLTVYSEAEFTTDVTIGSTYVIQVAGSGSLSSGWRTAWIDYNDNQIFEQSEIVFDGGYTIDYVTIPNDTNIIGLKRLRVISANSSTTIDPCGTYNYGEAEDYFINITDSVVEPCYCTPIYYLFAHAIQNFRLNKINNCDSGYDTLDFHSIYPDSIFITNLEAGGTYRINISDGSWAGNHYQYTAWIDFDDNYIFDSNEIIINNSSIQVLDDYFTVPNFPNVLGKHKLRIKISDNNTPISSCFATNLGETEDYYVNIVIQDTNQIEVPDWQKLIHLPTYQHAYGITETYDNGYAIILSNGNGVNQLTLLKLSIDGDTLWSKIHHPSLTNNAFDIDTTYDGGFVICGSTVENDSLSVDPFVLKLDACANEQWKKYYGNIGNYDYASHIIQKPDSNYILLVKYLGGPGGERITMMELDTLGNVEWQNDYTHHQNSEPQDLILTSDGGYLITGHTYTPFIYDTTIIWQRSMAIKVDSSGNEEWEKIIDTNPYALCSSPSSIEMDDEGYIIIANIMDTTYWSRNIGIYRIDKYGNLLWKNNITNQQEYRYFGLYLRKFSDNKFALIYARYDICDDYAYRIGAYTIDSTAIIIDSLLVNDYSYHLGDAIISENNKLLITGSQSLPNDADIIVFKLNEDLSFDSLYNYSLNYDSLCSIIIEAPIINSDESIYIKTYPNPTCDGINIIVEDYNNETYSVELINSSGNNLKCFYECKGQNFYLDCNNLDSGIYFIRVILNGNNSITRKIIIN